MRIVLANYKTNSKRKLKLSIRTAKHVYGIFWERRKNQRHNYGGKSIFGYFRDSRTVEYFTRGWHGKETWSMTFIGYVFGTIINWIKHAIGKWPKRVVSIADKASTEEVAHTGTVAINPYLVQQYLNQFGHMPAGEIHVVDNHGNHIDNF